MLSFKRIHYWLFIFIFLPFFLPAQTGNHVKKGDIAFSNKEYRKAWTEYGKAAKLVKKDLFTWFKYAQAARLVGDYKTAEKYFTKILENSESDQLPMTVFWLAQVKKCLGNYEEAGELFKQFSQWGHDIYYTYWAANEISVCEWAAALSPSTHIQIDLLNENINSNYSETAPIEMGNHLYYTSFRSPDPTDKHTPKRHLMKMMVSKNEERGRPVVNELNAKGYGTGNTAFSMDWQRMYFTVCEYISEEAMQCKIYYREQDDKGRWKKESIALPSYINWQGYTTTHPAIGFDIKSEKEILYFSSDRPGGAGKMDIWYCTVKKDGFSPPRNLWQINTPENEITPSFHNQSQVLTFSSDGLGGLGGFDIYYCEKIKENTWNRFFNMGRPINSGYDDYFFSKNTPGNRAYFSSNRPGSRHPRQWNEGCCTDIYKVYFNGLASD